MFTKSSVSTFGNLLTSINRRVENSNKTGGWLKDFKSLSVGVDEYSTSYPYLMVFPVREIVQRRYTNDFADVIRRVQFMIRTIKPTQEASFGQANGLANNVKMLFNRTKSHSEWKLKNLQGEQIVFNTVVSNVQFKDYNRTKNGVMAEGSLFVDFYCQIQTDTLKTQYDVELHNTNLKELTKIVHEIIKYHKSFIPEVKTLKYGSIEPISHYPAVTVVPDSADINNRFVGADSFDSDYVIYVLSDYLNVPDSIYQNLDIIHRIRDIMYANKFLFKRSYDFTVDTINFGTAFVEDKGYFTSQLVLNSRSLEPH